MKPRLLLATFALVTIPLSACTNSSDSSDGERGADGGTEIRTAELVALIEDGMEDVTTFRVTSDAGEDDDGGVGSGIPGSAEYDYRVSPPSARTVSMLEAGEPTEMIAVGDDLFIQMGDSWTQDTRYTADGTDQHDAVAMLVELVGDADRVVREGDDVDTYTAIHEPGTITMRTTISFDEQGRLGSFEVSTTDAEGATSSLGSSEFSGYGAEVSIEAPPAAAIIG